MNYVLRCCKSSRLLKPKLIVLCLMSLFAIECQSSILKNDTNKKQEVYSKLENAVKAELNDPELIYSIIWKGKCIKNNYEFVHNKSMYWAKSKLELVNAKKE